ncbi:hypothetical protein Aduo_011589 [Ancylostoma duodenale]
MKDRLCAPLLLIRCCCTNKPVAVGHIFLQLTAILCFVIIFVVGLPRLVSHAERYLSFRFEPRGYQQQYVDDDNIPLRDTILTAKGVVTYTEIEQNVFRPCNYRIIEPSFPIPKLDFISKPTCKKIFEDWLNITSRPAPRKPPEKIEDTDRDDFLLNGYSTLDEYSYRNEKTPSELLLWDSEIDELMKKPRSQVTRYRDGASIYYALRDYPLTNKTGFVIGSRHPWIEVQALRSGASEVYTVEYADVKITEETRIKYIHPIKFAEQWEGNAERFDFAITFSSIEHSGLGRYGDPVDPIGDMREVQKVMCLLKKGGLFFVGFPRGRDSILYNLHRVYGRTRLAMIMAGYEWVAMYRGDSPYPQWPRREDYEEVNVHKQELYVLRKP